MKSLIITLILTACYFTQLKAQSAGDYRSQTSGNWNTASNWQIYSTSSGWSTATSKPGSSRNVTIKEGHTITLDGSNSCNNLTVETGAVLNSAVNAAESTYYIRVGGVSGSNAVVQNDGLIGSTNGVGDGIILEAAAAAASTVIKGSGVCQVARLRAVSANANNFTMEIDQDITVTAIDVPAFTAYYNSSTSTVNENYTFTINPGKTVKILNGNGYFHAAANTSANPGGNYTYNINGTLDISNSTVTSQIIPISNSASDKNVTLNINGTLKTGTGLNLVNSSPSGSNDGNVVINVNNGGIIDASNATTFTTGDNYFRLAGSGALKRSVDNTDVSFPVGLQSASSANPVILNNSGTETNFSVNLLGSFDISPVSTQVVNRQWNITPDETGANASIKLQWKTSEHGAGFDVLQSVSLARLDGSTWSPSAVSTATGPDASGFYEAEASGITSFGAFSLQNSSTLPLNFVSFDAKLVNKQFSPEVALNWTTQNEVNTENFVIERSLDGNNFVSIGSISSKNASGTHFYSFIDRSPIPNTSYYRLKQIDKDGKFDFSDIRGISNSFGIKFSVYPNPSTEKINILHPIADNKTLVKIIDFSGKLVGSYLVTAGNTITTISVANLSSSLYFLYFEKQDLNFTSKFIKK